MSRTVCIVTVPGHGGPTSFPRTVPKTGLPHRPIQEPVPDPPAAYPGQQTMDGRIVPDHYESLNSLNTHHKSLTPHERYVVDYFPIGHSRLSALLTLQTALMDRSPASRRLARQALFSYRLYSLRVSASCFTYFISSSVIG